MQVKRFIISLISLLSAVGLVLGCLYLPMAHILLNAQADIAGSIPGVNGDYTLIAMLKGNLIDIADFYAVWDSASGPFWLALGSMSFNFISMVACVFIAILSIINIIISFTDKKLLCIQIAQRKILLFGGYFGVVLLLICVGGFYALNTLSQGYMQMDCLIAQYLCGGISLLMIVLGYKFTGKYQTVVKLATSHNPEIQQNKDNILVQTLTKKPRRNIAPFALSLILSIGMIAFFFLEHFSIDPFTNIAYNLFSLEAREFFLSWSFYSGPLHTFSMLLAVCTMIACAFLVVYSILGLIRSIFNKGVTGIAKQVRRWSFTVLITFSIFICIFLGLIFCAFCSICYQDPTTIYFFITLIIPISIFVPFLLTLCAQFAQASCSTPTKSVCDIRQPISLVSKPEELNEEPFELTADEKRRILRDRIAQSKGELPLDIDINNNPLANLKTAPREDEQTTTPNLLSKAEQKLKNKTEDQNINLSTGQEILSKAKNSKKQKEEEQLLAQDTQPSQSQSKASKLNILKEKIEKSKKADDDTTALPPIRLDLHNNKDDA